MMLGSQGDTLKETEGSQDMLYMQLLLQACRSSALSCTLSCLSKVSIAGTVGSNEKVAPNKATNNFNWETRKVWTSLSIDSPW
jgi:hypothetical protein